MSTKLSPEQKKEIEAIKTKNATMMKENAQIKNLNGDLEKARTDDKDKNYADAATLMQHDVAIKPDEPLLWVELGQAQLGLKQYSDAETSLNKAITLETAAKKPNAEVIGSAGNALGEAFADDNKIPESQAAYDAAAKANPAQARHVLPERDHRDVAHRAGRCHRGRRRQGDCRGSHPAHSLLPEGPGPDRQSHHGSQNAENRCASGMQEAYEKYLQLAPNGQFANDAKQVLAEMTTAPAPKARSTKPRSTFHWSAAFRNPEYGALSICDNGLSV